MMKRIAIAALALLVGIGSALAQGQPGPGQVMGNSSAAGRPARAENIFAIFDRALVHNAAEITNCSLVASVASNNLTIALKTQAGADPSASSPCVISFRNVTLATGDYTAVNMTAATSAVFNSGSHFGVSVNATPFKLRVFAINNGGTVVLGAAVLSGTGAFYSKNEAVLQSSTACSACATATASGTLYSTAAQTSKAVRELGWMEWDSGLATAGVWAAGPTEINLNNGPGYFRAGQPTGNVRATEATTQPAGYTSTTYVVTTVTVDITPTSKSNYISCQTFGSASVLTNGNTGAFIIQRGGVNVGRGYSIFAIAVSTTNNVAMFGTDYPASTATLTYAVFIKSTGGGGILYPNLNGLTEDGANITCWEVAG